MLAGVEIREIRGQALHLTQLFITFVRCKA